MKDKSWNPYTALTDEQQQQLAAFQAHLLQLNRRVNLVSRETTAAAFEERHLLHALALRHRAFPPGSTVVDWGTGGGLPAIPLAICFPDVAVHAVDAVGKKIQAVQAMGRRLGLKNLHPWQGRAETWPGTTAYSVSRATAPLRDLWAWHIRVCEPALVGAESGFWPSGLICLKGGDLTDEINGLHDAFPGLQVDQTPLGPLLRRAYFAGKYIVTVREGKESI